MDIGILVFIASSLIWMLATMNSQRIADKQIRQNTMDKQIKQLQAEIKQLQAEIDYLYDKRKLD